MKLRHTDTICCLYVYARRTTNQTTWNRREHWGPRFRQLVFILGLNAVYFSHLAVDYRTRCLPQGRSEKRMIFFSIYYFTWCYNNSTWGYRWVIDRKRPWPVGRILFLSCQCSPLCDLSIERKDRSRAVSAGASFLFPFKSEWNSRTIIGSGLRPPYTVSNEKWWECLLWMISVPLPCPCALENVYVCSLYKIIIIQQHSSRSSSSRSIWTAGGLKIKE